jgi:membrane protein DedA with SNARE-associated domain
LCDIRAAVTEETFLQLCDGLSATPWLQWLLIIAGTCFIEDPARCGVALLVAGGHLGWWTAFPAMVIGAMAGDLCLYLAGRFAMQFLVRWGWLDPVRLTWMEATFGSHAAKTTFIARFLPGARSFGYLAVGIVRYPFPRFLLILTAAAVAQTLLFLQLGEFIGERLLPLLKGRDARFAAIAAVVLAGVLVHRTLARRRKKKAARAREAATEPPDPLKTTEHAEHTA